MLGIYKKLNNPEVSTYIFAASSGINRARDVIDSVFRKIYNGKHDISETVIVFLKISSGTPEISIDEIGIINDTIQKTLGNSVAIVMDVEEKEFDDKIEIELLFTNFDIDFKDLDTSKIFNSFSPGTKSLPIYFLEEEYSKEEISEMISYLSDIYREIGGDGLKIKGFSRVQIENFVEPLLY